MDHTTSPHDGIVYTYVNKSIAIIMLCMWAQVLKQVLYCVVFISVAWNGRRWHNWSVPATNWRLLLNTMALAGVLNFAVFMTNDSFCILPHNIASSMLIPFDIHPCCPFHYFFVYSASWVYTVILIYNSMFLAVSRSLLGLCFIRYNTQLICHKMCCSHY